jgi:hypothetical protein
VWGVLEVLFHFKMDHYSDFTDTSLHTFSLLFFWIFFFVLPCCIFLSELSFAFSIHSLFVFLTPHPPIYDALLLCIFVVGEDFASFPALFPI